LSVGIISKLYDHGYTKINDILSISKSDLLKIDGFKETLSSKIVSSINSVVSKPIYLGLLMVASLEFNSGFGIKKFIKILNTYPSLMDTKITLEQIVNIDGFQTKTAQQFIDNVDNFKIFLESLNLNYYCVESGTKKQLKKNPKIEHKNFVITGFRDSNLITIIDENGGTIQGDVNMKTNYVIVKDDQTNSSKVKKANIIGISIVMKEDFISNL